MSDYKIGLALGGGAARGWSHIGIIKSLEAMNIKPDIVCGTSIGALVGAAYVAGNLDKLEQWVCELSKLETAKYFSINSAMQGFVNKQRLQQFLNDYVVSKQADIADFSRPFASVATDLHSGREIWNTSGNVMDAVWSSISLPGLFPAIKLKDRWLIDGGLVNPVPVSLCRALGADIVIAVNLNSDIVGKHFQSDEKEKPTEPDTPAQAQTMVQRFGSMVADYTQNLFASDDDTEEPPNLLDAVAATINITQDRITRSRMAGDPPEICLTPRLAHIGLLEFYRASEAIQEGVDSVQRQQRDFDFYLNTGVQQD